MAPKATVYKVELQVSDLDRHYYATHMLTLAQHPSETEGRLLVRLLAFALFAHERLEFGRGLSTDSDPDLWRSEFNGDIALWIELGQPDEARIRKACGRAEHVVIINYHGRASDPWWDKLGPALQRLQRVSVIEIPAEQVATLPSLLERSMRLNCIIQDGQVQLMDASHSITLEPNWRLAARL